MSTRYGELLNVSAPAVAGCAVIPLPWDTDGGRVPLFCISTPGELNRGFGRARHALVTFPDPCCGDGIYRWGEGRPPVRDGKRSVPVRDSGRCRAVFSAQVHDCL